MTGAIEKRIWYFCSDCDVVFGRDEARVGGCGTYRCSGSLHWLEMSEEEYEQYANLLNEIGVKEFADRLRHRRGEFSYERHH